MFPCTGLELVTLATEKGRALIFPVAEIPPRAGSAMGVKAIRMAAGDKVLGFQLALRKRQGLKVWTNRGREVIVRETSYKPAKRGGKGAIVIQKGNLSHCEWPPVLLQPGGDVDEEPDAEELMEGDLDASEETDQGDRE